MGLMMIHLDNDMNIKIEDRLLDVIDELALITLHVIDLAEREGVPPSESLKILEGLHREHRLHQQKDNKDD